MYQKWNIMNFLALHRLASGKIWSLDKSRQSSERRHFYSYAQMARVIWFYFKDSNYRRTMYGEVVNYKCNFEITNGHWTWIWITFFNLIQFSSALKAQKEREWGPMKYWRKARISFFSKKEKYICAIHDYFPIPIFSSYFSTTSKVYEKSGKLGKPYSI